MSTETNEEEGTQPEPKKGKYSIPDWAGDPFHRFLNEVDEARRLLHLSTNGIAVLRAMPKAIEALGVEAEDEENRYRDRLRDATLQAELAQREVESGFPILHAQALVSLWGSLEALIKNFLSAWLEHSSEGMENERLRKLKVRLGEYLDRTEQERFEYLVDLIDEDLGSSHRYGVNRFDSLLAEFGLRGPIPEGLQRDLFELQQLRHVLVHRRGVADRRLANNCPWLGLSVGDVVKIDHAIYARLQHSASEYVLELIQRLRERFGIGRYVPPDNVAQAQTPQDADDKQRS